jgi:hypothetical protein
MEIFGCQECTTLELVNPNVRILSNQSTIGNEIPVSHAQVRVYQTKKNHQTESLGSDFKVLSYIPETKDVTILDG